MIVKNFPCFVQFLNCYMYNARSLVPLFHQLLYQDLVNNKENAHIEKSAQQ